MSMGTVTLEENTDGELYFELPDDVLDVLGWDDDTVLDFTVIGDCIRITKAQDQLSGRPGAAEVVTGLSEGDGGVGGGYGGVVEEPSY